MSTSSHRSPVDIIFWLPAINPYWARRLSALHDTGNVTFLCLFNRPVDPTRDWVIDDASLQFPHQFLPGGIRRYTAAAKSFLRNRPARVLTFHFKPSLWPAILASLVFRAELAFYAEKTWDSWVRRTKLKELLKRLIISRAATIFVPGDDAAAYLRTYAPRAEYRQLPHALDVERIQEAALHRKPSESARLLYLGRFIPEKGLLDLLQACDTVWQGGQQFELAFVGSGPLEDTLRAWVLRHPERASLRGFVQASEVPSVLAQFDVLVFPTLGDPYGLVVDEAMASGMAVISSTAAGEIEERLRRKDGPARGLVFPAGDVDELAKCLIALTRDRKLRASMGASAKEWANSHSSLTVWTSSITAWVARTR